MALSYYNDIADYFTATTLTGTVSAGSLCIDELDILKKQLEELKREVASQSSKTAAQAAIEQQQAYNRHMERERMMERYPAMAVYGNKVYASDYVKPGSIVVLDQRQFSREAASQFAKQNPGTQVMVAPDPKNAMAIYPGVGGKSTAPVYPAGAAASVPPPAKKPLSSTRPEQQRWKYASL